VPRTWETSRAARTPGFLSRVRRPAPVPASGRGRVYRLARSAQGFMTGLALGVLWALWVVRGRRPGPAVLDPAAGGAVSRAR
jgi:hypothetical protein